MDETCKAAMRGSEALDAVANFLVIVFEDGDYLNDFLTHVPECGQPLIQLVGQLLATAIGF